MSAAIRNKLCSWNETDEDARFGRVAVCPHISPSGCEEAMMNARQLVTWVTLGTTILMSAPSLAEGVEQSIAACLNAWGTHPFGENPRYKTLATSVKVFGIGRSPADYERTNGPSLVLVNPGVNVMGGTTLELLNPNGWYCFRSNVNVMGDLNIRADCRAHLASASDGATVLGSNSDSKSVTVMGSTRVAFVGCD
jgi:hypothetical protein